MSLVKLQVQDMSTSGWMERCDGEERCASRSEGCLRARACGDSDRAREAVDVVGTV
jgi:hypothetical protein